MNPILFFVFIVAIDLILKSSKNKKKAEEARRRGDPKVGSNPTKPKSLRNLRTILEEELNKQKEVEEQKRIKPQISKPIVKEKRIDRQKDFDMGLGSSISKPMEVSKPLEVTKETGFKSKKLKIEMKNDILTGVIFSEILSPPKSIQNQKRSL